MRWKRGKIIGGKIMILPPMILPFVLFVFFLRPFTFVL